jgi:HlyD family secretion protein
VISRSVDVGQTVAASLQAPTLFVIAEDLAKMQVDTSVAEADVSRLGPGMAATFTVDAWPGEVFRGTVRQVRNAPQTVQNVVTYDAVVDVPNPGLKLKPGMTATVTFVHAEKDEVLRVPNAALRFRPPPGMARSAGGSGPGAGGGSGARSAGAEASRAAPGTRTVWVLRGEKPEPRAVRVGVSDGTHTEVGSGLLEGDAVITDAIGPAVAGSQPAGAPGGGLGGGRRGPF